MKRVIVIVIVIVGSFTSLRAQTLADSLFFEARRMELYGKPDSAYQYLMRSYELNPESSATLYQLALEAVYYLKDDSVAEQYLQRAVELSPKNYWYKDALMNLYARKGSFDKAINIAEELFKSYPDKTELLMMLETLYSRTGDFKKAEDALNKIELIEGKSAQLSMERIRLYLRKEDEAAAFKEMDAILDDYENADDELCYALMNAMVYKTLAENSDTAEIMNRFRKILSQPQRNVAMAELCFRFLNEKKVDEDVIKPFVDKMLEIDPGNEIASRQKLIYALEDNDENALLDVCQKAIDNKTEDPLFYFYKGVVYMRKKDYGQALDALLQQTRHINSSTNIELIVDCYSAIGDMYHQLGDDRNAFLAYDTCLMYRPDNPLTLNNYAYYLSLQKKQLDKAAEMSMKSLEKEPDNYIYIDTYAWILFQQKKYKEAKVQIDRAVTLMEADKEKEDRENIINHQKEIYSKIKDKR